MGKQHHTGPNTLRPKVSTSTQVSNLQNRLYTLIHLNILDAETIVAMETNDRAIELEQLLSCVRISEEEEEEEVEELGEGDAVDAEGK